MVTAPRSVLVIGGGLGGTKVVERLRAHGFAGEITLVGDEAHFPYDRPPLSKQILAGDWDLPRITLHDAGTADRLGARYLLGNAVVALEAGKAALSDGTVLTADHIVIATGLTPRRVPGQPGTVHTLRSLDDALALRAALDAACSLVIVGGGFIGAEVATSALRRGVSVEVLEADRVPMARILGTTVGELAARLMTDHGVHLVTGTVAEGFDVDARGRTVVKAAGERLVGDVVLVGVGGVPSLDWFPHAAVDPNLGIRCDSSGRVHGEAELWAVGDVAAWQVPEGGHRRTEHWSSATEQAEIVAATIAGSTPAPRPVPYFWSDQFGVKIQVFGRPDEEDTVVPLHGDGHAGTVVAYMRDGALAGIAAFGAPRIAARYRTLVAERASRTATMDFSRSLS